VLDPWYPPPGEYYVPLSEAVHYPLRQGDLVGPVTIDGRATPIVQVVHPTCELGKGQVDRIQVCAVEELSRLDDDFTRSCVVAGMRETGGSFRVAFAHTFFLPGIHAHDEGMYGNFRRRYLVDRAEVCLENRSAALTHDARVFFIRRWIYFRFRILLSLNQVRGLEADRIRADRAFEGPRPAWADDTNHAP